MSGWGVERLDNGEYDLTGHLDLENIRVNPHQLCQRIFSRESLSKVGVPSVLLRQQMPKGFHSDIACAGSEFKPEGACEGDSGSPLIRLKSGTARKEPYYEQAYIVSTGVSCELEATLYIRVADRRILTWIQQQTGEKLLSFLESCFTIIFYQTRLHS